MKKFKCLDTFSKQHEETTECSPRLPLTPMQIFTKDLTKKLMDEMPEMSIEDARIFAKSNWEGTAMTP